jgi:predicted nucleotidyltransferase
MQDQTSTHKTEAQSKVPLRTIEHPPIDEALIQEITRRIVEGVHPNRVILFGSRARGDFRPDSDLDIFVEMESVEKPYYRHGRVRGVLRGIPASMDLIVMTPEEVEVRRNSLVSLVPIIEREGRVLFQH